MDSLSARLLSRANVDKQAFALMLMNFLVNLGTWVITPVLPEIKSDFGVSYGEVGLMVGAFGFARLAVDLPVGWASERIRTRLILLAGTILLTGGSLYAALLPSFTGLVIARAVMGAGSAMCTTTALIILSQLSTPQNRAKMMSMYPMGAFAGASISPLVGSFLAARFEWQSAFYFCAATTFAAFISVVITQRNSQSGATAGTGRHHSASRSSGTSAEALAGVSPVAIRRAVIAVSIAALLAFAARHALSTALIPLYAGGALGLGVETVGLLLSSSTIVTMLALLFGGSLADRYGRMKVFVPGMTITAVGASIIPFAGDLTTLAIGVGLFSLGGVTVSLLGVLIADLSDSKSLNRNIGLFRFLVDVGVFGGPAALSALVDYFGFGLPLYLDAAAAFISAALVLFFLPSSPFAKWRIKVFRQGA